MLVLFYAFPPLHFFPFFPFSRALFLGSHAALPFLLFAKRPPFFFILLPLLYISSVIYISYHILLLSQHRCYLPSFLKKKLYKKLDEDQYIDLANCNSLLGNFFVNLRCCLLEIIPVPIDFKYTVHVIISFLLHNQSRLSPAACL